MTRSLLPVCLLACAAPILLASTPAPTVPEPAPTTEPEATLEVLVSALDASDSKGYESPELEELRRLVDRIRGKNGAGATSLEQLEQGLLDAYETATSSTFGPTYRWVQDPVTGEWVWVCIESLQVTIQDGAVTLALDANRETVLF